MLEGLAVATCLPPGRIIFGNWEKFILSSKREGNKSERGEAMIEAERREEEKKVYENKIMSSKVGGEQRRNQEFRFRFRQCWYRNFWQEKAREFVIL